jgi:cell wall-associated NlpC family hydrolase
VTLDPRRAAVLDEAETWRGTPYHHAARLKGIGCDCLSFLVEVYQRCRIIAPLTLPFYRPDAVMHDGDPRYFEGVLAHGREVATAQPGDVVLYRWGRGMGHGGIVVDWPWILHADPYHGVNRADGTQGRLARREHKFIDPF